MYVEVIHDINQKAKVSVRLVENTVEPPEEIQFQNSVKFSIYERFGNELRVGEFEITISENGGYGQSIGIGLGI